MSPLIFPWWYCLLIFFGFQKYHTTLYYLVLYFLDILKSLLSCFPTAFLSISVGISPTSVLDSQFFPLLANGYLSLIKWRPWESEKPMFWITALLLIVSILSEQTLDSVSSVMVRWHWLYYLNDLIYGINTIMCKNHRVSSQSILLLH